MKTSDFIFKFKSYKMREEGLCRVRFFVNTKQEMICVLTDIDIMSNAPYLDTVCDTVINLLYDNGYLLNCQVYVLHDDFDNSMAIIDKYGNVERHLSKKQIEILTECDENEFAKKSVDILSIKRQIEKKRYEINPFISRNNSCILNSVNILYLFGDGAGGESMKKENDDFEKLGPKIKELRIGMDLTQAQVAKALNVTPGYISNVENNRTAMSLRILMYYAKLMNITLDSLVGRIEPEYRKNALDNELSELISQMDDKDKQKLIKTIRIWM